MRRQIRDYVKSEYKILNDVIRKRPKWCPLKVWSWGAKIFIDTEKLRDFMENGVDPKSKR